MTFPNGYRGVSKLFTSEILSLISGVLLIAAGAVGIGGVASAITAEDGVAAITSLGGASILGGISGILVVIAYILKLVGLHQAGKDDDTFFRNAFLISIFALVLAIASAILGAIFGANSVVDDITTLIQRIANIVVIFFTIGGIQKFAVELNHEKMASRGNKIAWLIATPYILAAIAGIIVGLFGAGGENVAGVVTLISGILTIIGSIIFLVYLGQAKKMLKEN